MKRSEAAKVAKGVGAFASALMVSGMCSVYGCGVEEKGLPEPVRNPLFSRVEKVAETHAQTRASLGASGGISAVNGKFVSDGARNPTRGAEMRALFPTSAKGETQLEVRGGVVRLTAVGTADSPALLDRGRLFYERAYGDYADRIVTANEHSVEEFVFLRSAAAGDRFSWRLLGDSLHVDVLPDESLRISLRGRTSMEVPRPYAIDARGTKQEAHLKWDEPTRTITVSLADARSLSYPVLLDPTIEVGLWSTISLEAPFERPMVFDPAREEAVTIAGDDTILLRKGTWRSVFNPSLPTRAGYGLVFDQKRNESVLFGGYQAGTYFSDTWAWNGASWVDLTATAGVAPSARNGNQMAYDSVRKRAVLFGGFDGTAMLNDTWEWDGATWAKRSPAQSPPARFFGSMVFDEDGKRIVLFGGANSSNTNTTLDDTWVWDGTNWTEIVGATHPSTRHHPSMAYDPVRKQTVLFGGRSANTFFGDTWVLAGATWTKLSPAVSAPGRNSAAIYFDPIGARIVMWGGTVGVGIFGGQYSNETWAWDGANWSKIQAYATVSMAFQAATYDSARNQIVVFGGASEAGGPATNNMWLSDGFTFTPFNGTRPSARTNSALAFDSERGEVVLFGGQNGNTILGETWTWNGAVWTKKTPAHSPPNLAQVAMAFDAERKQVVMFGGALVANGSSNDTWLWDGTDWTKAAPATVPPAVNIPGIAYDAKRKRVVMFGGASGGSVTVDTTWTWDGTNWTLQAPAHKPSARWFHAMTYDPVRNVTLMFGGISETDTWQWDGTDWARLAARGPNGRWNASFIYDAVHKQTLLFGGHVFGAPIQEIWWLNLMGGGCAADAECDTGHCVDGTCCQAAECGLCEACNVVGSEGICAALVSAEDDTCMGSNACDKNAVCKSNLGTACTANGECASGICVDGVCCDTGCTGLCFACRGDMKVSGASGICGVARAGLDPHNDCADDQAASCLRNGACDGNGACQIYPKGTSCGESVCVQNRAVGKVCDGISACGANTSGVDCAPFICNLATGGCTSTCERDVDCVATARCDSTTGTCVARGGSVCKDARTVLDPNGKETDCGLFKCEAGRCVTVTVCYDEHTLLSEDGKLSNCDPYTCSGNACRAQCASITDCAAPAICNSNGECVSEDTAAPSEPGCECTMTKKRSGAGEFALAIAAVALFGLRRRSKHRDPIRTRNAGRPLD